MVEDARKSLKGVFKNKNLMLLILGQLVSNVGNAVHSAAVAWYIMSLVGESNAGTFMGIFGMCNLIPMIVFGPISGVFVDKLDRKKIIVGTDIIRGGFLLILAVLTYYKIFPLPVLFTVTVINAFVGTFFNPAVDASIPNIVDEDDLARANSINGMTRQLSWILGATISGFLYYSIGIVGIFVINGISFILSGFSETFINLPPIKKSKKAIEEKEESTFWKDFKGGIIFIRTKKALVILLGFCLVMNFIINPVFQIVFPKAVNFTLGMSAKEYGIFQAIICAGSILGMALISILPQNKKYYKLIGICVIAHGVILGLIGVPMFPIIYSQLNNFIVFIILSILLFILGAFNALLNVPMFTVLQKMVPDEYRGRFFGILNTATQGIVPLGLIVMGIISDKVPCYTVFIGSGIIFLLAAIGIFFVPELKKL